MRALLIGLGVALGVWVAAIAGLFVAGRRTHARELAMLLPNLLTLLKGLLHDGRVRWSDKVLLFLAVAWVVSPIDLIPEFIPVLGPLDDVVVVALVLRRLVRRAGHEVVSENWRGDPEVIQKILRLVRASA